MSLKIFSVVAVGSLLVTFVAGCSTVAARHKSFVNEHLRHSFNAQDQDAISGDWNVTFYVHEMKTPATFTFKLEGTQVSGTAYSEHTGPGTIRDGKWVDGKLSFTLDFKKHQSIVVAGALKDGRLSGEFSTEGFTDKWDAVRK